MSGSRVLILDYKMSNLRSAAKALERLGASVTVTDAPLSLDRFDAVVLPGVGAFGEAMRRIREQGLDRTIGDAVERDVPVLGICLGLQLLFDESEESPGVAGLGVLPGAVRRLTTTRKLPQIGWNTVDWRRDTPFAPPADAGTLDRAYYFVHSFSVHPEREGHVLGVCDHGGEFVAAAGDRHVAGVQFHPEKSSRAGLALLDRWLTLVGEREGVGV